MPETPVTFAGLLRKLRTEAGLTQEELADAARLSVRSVSDLERGVNLTARKETARLLADALRLTGQARAEFEAIARGRPVPETADPAGAAGLGGDGISAPRTLPYDIASFTGRQQELRRLADAAAASGGLVGIYAIGGMAGIGKTAFAVHAAHLLADQFPDGQLFLPLHGHTPGQHSVQSADALASLLQMTGVPAAQIPPGTEARAALWRDRVAGKRLLLVLDDAAGSEQVYPLIPGTGDSLVMVTSRRHLSALEDAMAISLDTLPPAEAAGLLARVAGRPGLSPEDPAVEEITRLCGYLPLAMGLVARQLHHHPAWPLADLAADLAEAKERLDLMTAEDLSVTAAFNLSYNDLTPDQQRLFRRLGLHPGTDIDAYAAAALDDTGLSTGRRALEALYDQNLLTEPAYGRYRMHDLIREHARTLAVRLDSADDRELAVARLLDYYQHTANHADALLARQTRPAPSPEVDITPAAVPVLPDREHALAWARTERLNLLACLDHAAATGQHVRVIALTAGTAALLRHDGPWAEAIKRHTTALQAAQYLGDQPSQAHTLNSLGEVRRMTADYPGAAQALEKALDIYRDIGDQPGQANALNSLGELQRLIGDFPDAAQSLEEALGIYRDIGHQSGQANDLLSLGEVRRLTGDYARAAQALEEALDIYRDIGEPLGQANALFCLGMLRRFTADHPGAIQALEEALGICKDLGNPLGQANVLANLGIVRRVTADYSGAAQALQEALDIFTDIGDRGGEATALNEVGTLHLIRSDLDQARSCHQQALHLAGEIGSTWDEAHALAGLGRCDIADGNAAEGEDRLRQALEIFQRIGTAEAADVAAELDAFAQGQTAS